jgi:hypothetical protein
MDLSHVDRAKHGMERFTIPKPAKRITEHYGSKEKSWNCEDMLEFRYLGSRRRGLGRPQLWRSALAGPMAKEGDT